MCGYGGGGVWVGRCRRGCHLARSSAVAVAHLDVGAAVALLALDLAVILVFLAAIFGC